MRNIAGSHQKAVNSGLRRVQNVKSKNRGQPEAWTVSIARIKERMDLEGAKVLDIGFGAGGFSLALVNEGAVLVNMDISLEAMERMKGRGDAPFHSQLASGVTLPYRGSTFDLVILNGVLEYTAQGQSGSPKDTHIKILKYVRRLLKPGGLFYLGIENRYYLKFLLGCRDHYEMRFSNILPRRISTFISKHILKDEVRNWIYSYNEYIRLLSEAGFNYPRFFTALPNYKAPEYITPIEDKEKIKENILKLNTRKLYRYVAYALAHSNYLYKKIGPDFVVLSMVY